MKMPDERQIVAFKYKRLMQGALIRRYKRFLADVDFHSVPVASGGTDASAPTVVHCPNTGPMTGLLDRHRAPVLCSIHDGKTRKYAHTLEAIQPGPGNVWVGVHSALANKMVHCLLESRALQAEVGDYTSFKSEVKFGHDGKSRVDFVLTRPIEGGGRGPARLAYVEVKSVTLSEPHAFLPDATIGLFPDTVSERAQKHVTELVNMVQAGNDALCIFLIQRGDCTHFAPSWENDAKYSSLLAEASQRGVKMIALRCELISDSQGNEAMVYFNGVAPIDLGYKKISQEMAPMESGVTSGGSRGKKAKRSKG